MSRVAGDTEQMKGFVHQLTTGFFQQIIMVIAVGTMLFTMNWKLALFTLLPAPLVVRRLDLLLEADLPALLPRLGRQPQAAPAC